MTALPASSRTAVDNARHRAGAHSKHKGQRHGVRGYRTAKVE